MPWARKCWQTARHALTGRRSMQACSHVHREEDRHPGPLPQGAPHLPNGARIPYVPPPLSSLRSQENKKSAFRTKQGERATPAACMVRGDSCPFCASSGRVSRADGLASQWQLVVQHKKGHFARRSRRAGSRFPGLAIESKAADGGGKALPLCTRGMVSRSCAAMALGESTTAAVKARAALLGRGGRDRRMEQGKCSGGQRGDVEHGAGLPGFRGQ